MNEQRLDVPTACKGCAWCSESDEVGVIYEPPQSTQFAFADCEGFCHHPDAMFDGRTNAGPRMTNPHDEPPKWCPRRRPAEKYKETVLERRLRKGFEEEQVQHLHALGYRTRGEAAKGGAA